MKSASQAHAPSLSTRRRERKAVDTSKKEGKSMNLEQIKFQTCPFDQEEGVLLTDIEELFPQTDEEGGLQYYCLAGRHTFTLDEDDEESS
jgi:hypothetical protein